MSELTQNVLEQAKRYMRNRRNATWRTYEQFKKQVDWLDDQDEYRKFISELTKILKR